MWTARRMLLWLAVVWILLAVLCAFGCPAPKQADKPSPYKLKTLDGIQVFRAPQKMTPEHKFCNPDYEFGPGEIPQISGRCLPVPISCDATRDYFYPERDGRCPGRI
jgi:hypothetical protein